MEERILFVDDDPNILEAYQRKLQHVLNVRTAQGPHLGLREIRENGPFAVVVADMNMPLMSGVEFLKQVREIAPDTVRMMLTGNADIKTAMDAVNEGNVFRFLTKPCPSKLMGDSLAEAIKQHRLVTAEKEVLEGTLKGTAELLTEILSWVAPDTFGRAIQLRNTVKAIAAKLDAENSWEIELAATLCQIGVMALPSELQAKAAEGRPLTEDEKKTLESVPAIGHELLERIPRMQQVAKIILYQHKNYDGRGFPHDAVAGKDIPLGSRILKIASDFQELRAAGRTREESIKAMSAKEGAYDPRALSAIVRESTQASTAADRAPVRSISLKELGAGLTLASPVTTTEGRMLVAAGTVISDAFLVRLQKLAATCRIKEPLDVFIHKPSG